MFLTHVLHLRVKATILTFLFALFTKYVLGLYQIHVTLSKEEVGVLHLLYYGSKFTCENVR